MNSLAVLFSNQAGVPVSFLKMHNQQDKLCSFKVLSHPSVFCQHKYVALLRPTIKEMVLGNGYVYMFFLFIKSTI